MQEVGTWKMATATEAVQVCMTVFVTCVMAFKWPNGCLIHFSSPFYKGALPCLMGLKLKWVNSSIVRWEEGIWVKVCGRLILVLLY